MNLVLMVLGRGTPSLSGAKLSSPLCADLKTISAAGFWMLLEPMRRNDRNIPDGIRTLTDNRLLGIGPLIDTRGEVSSH